MADFTFTLDNDIAMKAENTGGSFGVLDTGIYSFTIKSASIDKTQNGNNTINLGIETDTGHETTIYGMCIDPTWASGSENYDYPKWQSLASLCGMKTGERVPYKLELSNGQTKELTVFKELMGKKLKAAIQKSLSYYKGEVKEKNIIHSFYSEDGKALSELSSNKPAVKIDKIASRLSDHHDKTYKKHMASGGVSDTVEASTENEASIFN